MPALNRGITLDREAQTIYNSTVASGYRMKITARDGLNIDNNIFRFTRSTTNYTTGEKSDVFEGICSSEQLTALPIGAPDPADPNQYFRNTVVDLLFMTKKDADDTWTKIRGDIDRLIKAMKFNDVMALAETIRMGDAS